MNKDTWSGIGCLIIFMLIITTCTYYSSRKDQARRERKEFVTDSIAKREKYVKDSIDSVHNTPEYRSYQDSLHLVQEKMRENDEKATIVLVCTGDSVYHFMTQCFAVNDIGIIKLISEYQAKKNGLKKCYHCVRDLDGYIYEGDIYEYLIENFDKNEIIELYDITRADF